MNTTHDLHIEKEILPLFDYTLNKFSKKVLIDILEKPLLNKNDIILRQDIIKGFIENNNILKNYFYYVSNFKEVHYFLTHYKIGDLGEKNLKYRLFTSKKVKTEYKSKFIQMLLLFQGLHSNYISRLNIKVFPEFYKKKLLQMNRFLSSFNLNHYEEQIREYRIRDSDIIKLSSVIEEKMANGELSSFWEDFFIFEAYHSIGLGIIINNFKFPKFSENNFLLNDFYHPILSKPVINSFNTKSNVIILTGPNMSGKSTFLKTVSLCIYLGHVGIAVPASKAEIPFYEGISVYINHRDDILNGYSHFMTEIINLKKVITKVAEGKKYFAVFDELFSGTNPEDAFEICSTTINGLSNFKNSIFFISTHLQQLKDINGINNANVSTYYIDCQLIKNNPTFTYKLKKGWSELRVGRILFDKEGLNEMLR